MSSNPIFNIISTAYLIQQSFNLFSQGVLQVFSLVLDIGNVAIWHFDWETNDCPSDIGANLVTPSLWFNQILKIFWIQDFQKTWELGTAGFVIFQDCSYTQVDDELAADLIGAWRENLWKNRHVVMILLRNKAHHWKSHEIKKHPDDYQKKCTWYWRKWYHWVGKIQR